MTMKKMITGLEIEEFMNQAWPKAANEWCLTEYSPIDTDLDFSSSTGTFKARFPKETYDRELFDIHVGYQGNNENNDPTKGQGYRLIELIDYFLKRKAQQIDMSTALCRSQPTHPNS